MFRRDRGRTDKEKGGGVLLYVSEKLSAVRELDDVEYPCESLWVKILDKKKSEIFVGVCYKSPTASDEEVKAICDLIKHFSQFDSVLIGDFNYPDINWRLRESGNQGSEFLDLVNDCFLSQHVKEPTRGKNILDLIFSTEPSMITDVQVRSPVSNSDHNLITFQIEFDLGEEEKVGTKFRYDSADYHLIQQELMDIDWKEKFKSKDVEEMWVLLKNEIIDKRDKFVPKVPIAKRTFRNG